MKAPFPWFGGKSRVASLVWERFGDVKNYVEPFFGSGAVLLSRPDAPRIETVNDKDCYLANFWRAIARDPEGVARFADWPVNEADLHARHLWLVNQTHFRELMLRDPNYYDVQIAGWWVWGICGWIGHGWCDTSKLPHVGNAGQGINRLTRQLPHVGNAGQGINRLTRQLPHVGNAGRGINRLTRQLPHVGNAGRGINRLTRKLPMHVGKCTSAMRGINRLTRKLPHVGNAGRGINRLTRKLPHVGDAGRGINRLTRKLPHVGDAGRGINRLTRKLPHVGDAGRGINRLTRKLPHVGDAGRDLQEYFAELAARLRRVRVCCGDWKRVLTPAVTERHGVTGVFLDPPYADGKLQYSAGGIGSNIDAEVRAWALENGDNPKLRIALCGYEGDHLMPDGWSCVPWRARKGYQRADASGLHSGHNERVWFSPHCLRKLYRRGRAHN
jgi:hypothetical protein